MSKKQKTLLLAGLLAATGFGLFVVVFWTTRGREFFHDFRGTAPSGAFRFNGPQAGRVAVAEPEGLRFNLPSDRGDLATVRISLPLRTAGDFEVTASFEIIKAETPKTGYGVGVIMGIGDRARVGRFVKPGGGQVVAWDYWPVVDGERKFKGNSSPCIGNQGRIRLKRTGSILYFLWSPDLTDNDFEEINSLEFGDEDISFFTFDAETSREKRSLDVYLMDFKVWSGPATATIYRWSAGVLAALIVCLAGLMVWRLYRPGFGRVQSGV